MTIFLFSFLPISTIIGNSIININIFLIDFTMLIYCWKYKNWGWLKDKLFKILIIFYAYLIINSVFNYSINQNYGLEGIFRSLGFIKFILLVYSFKILISCKKQFDKLILFWTIIIAIIIIDVFFEFFVGHNILGFESLDKTRIISFFYNESVVGSFILTFGFVVCTYYFKKNLTLKKKLLLNLFLFILPISILITGERSNFLKSIILFTFIIMFINSNLLIINKKTLFALLISVIFLSISLNQTLFIKQTEFFKRITNVEKYEKISDLFQNIKYFAHYDVSLNIFKDYPLNGIGNKNFRLKCSDEKYYKHDLKFSNSRCSTHPHQIHFELLSEHGLIGYLLFFYLIYFFIRKNFLVNSKLININTYTKNFYIIVFLVPLLPSGSILSSFNGLLFWIIFALANFNEEEII